MRKLITSVSIIFVLAACLQPEAFAEPCLEITLTGTQGGPPAVNGLAGAGTLVRYGDSANNCSDLMLQFDAGRGTVLRLSALGISPTLRGLMKCSITLSLYIGIVFSPVSSGFCYRWATSREGARPPVSSLLLLCRRPRYCSNRRVRILSIPVPSRPRIPSPRGHGFP